MEVYLLEQIIGSKGPLAGANIKNITSVNGGSIHNAWQLNLNNNEKIFAKTTSLDNFEMLKFEAIGLNALNKYSDKTLLSVPKPICLQKLETHSILLIPWLNFSGGNATNLGKGLALLHKATAESSISSSFGWDTNGFIGLGKQPGGWDANWGECFTNLRLLPQIRIAEKWGLKLIELTKLVARIKSFLNRHSPLPSLVHGDLWQGNAGIDETGRGVIFDPAIWWADREVDIAMTKMFGGFSKEFYLGYEEIWPLPKLWMERVDIYNLYHLINHANIFGGHYEHQCIASIKKLNLFLKN